MLVRVPELVCTLLIAERFYDSTVRDTAERQYKLGPSQFCGQIIVAVVYFRAHGLVLRR